MALVASTTGSSELYYCTYCKHTLMSPPVHVGGARRSMHMKLLSFWNHPSTMKTPSWTRRLVLALGCIALAVTTRAQAPSIPSNNVNLRGNNGQQQQQQQQQQHQQQDQATDGFWDDFLNPFKQELRRGAIRDAMQHIWSNYEEHAFGADEINPLTGASVPEVWGGIAMTMIDGMDTLWVMDLYDEFYRARDYVATKLDFSQMGHDGRKFSIFETTIREVGGLLSAYELSHDPVFVEKARELVDLLTPAFEPKEGVFYTLFNPQTKEKSFQPWAQFRGLLADIGTLQMELRYLTAVTNEPKYAKMGDAFYKIVKREGSFNNTGLFPNDFDSKTGHFATSGTSISFGALGDSFYEYLLKVWILSGRREEDAYLREAYDKAIDGMEKYLLKYSEKDDRYFVQDAEVPSLKGTSHMQHLTCFLPGTLVLGAMYGTDEARNAHHLDIAKKLVETCYDMYHRQPSGLSADDTGFPGFYPLSVVYPLRPEVVESLMYLYRATKDTKYRDYGWKIFESIEKYCKTEYGYAAPLNVTQVPPPLDNRMESFFLAETLKYHYLLQSDEWVMPLDEYVFNTEAHPFGIQLFYDFP